MKFTIKNNNNCNKEIVIWEYTNCFICNKILFSFKFAITKISCSTGKIYNIDYELVFLQFNCHQKKRFLSCILSEIDAFQNILEQKIAYKNRNFQLIKI